MRPVINRLRLQRVAYHNDYPRWRSVLSLTERFDEEQGTLEFVMEWREERRVGDLLEDGPFSQLGNREFL